ncbi:UvrD-helicase domain-containing protein [Candidatus Saccharibacteria bacterium]|nr:UvrD-helicase domain-containing protein [Candidatus Saccharibacteria bacterium]
MNSSDLGQILEGLNPPQREAVEFGDGPLLILAGAGSGKTKVLTHRIAYLIATGRAKPSEILAVTFTNKAANEMRERLWRLLQGRANPAEFFSSSRNASSDPRGATSPSSGDPVAPAAPLTHFRGEDSEKNSAGLAPAGFVSDVPPRSFMPWMGTFHSIAVRILRRYGENIEIPRNFVILDETDRLSLIKKAMQALNITDKQFNPRSIASLISTAKNDCLSPNDYAAIAKLPAQKVAADVYPRYERLRKDAKSLDFDDLLLETVKLLKKVKEVRNELSNKFKHILIDEYQDTNKAQYQIVKLLLNKQRNICAVGDDWQSIYSWRGADFTNILNFERDFSGTKIVKLEQNYRSTEAILNAAHNVIVKNTRRTDKKLWTDKKGGSPVQIVPSSSELHEAEIIAQKIATEMQLGARQADEFAILYRTNAQSRAIEEIFLKYGLPYKIVGGVRFYDRAEIKDLMAYLRLLYQPFDRASFERIVNVPRRGLGETSVGRFLLWQGRRGTSIIDALINIDSCDELTPRARKSFKELGDNLYKLSQLIETISPTELLEKIIQIFDYRAYLDDGTPSSESRLENVAELVGVAGTFADLPEFLEEVALVSSADQTADKAVTLMTLHAAKGLEFPVVLMVGMEEGIFPGTRAEYEPTAMEEERRLAYVGMTRAREELILVFATSRSLYGRRQYNPPSRFLGDIDSEFAFGETVNDSLGAPKLFSEDFSPSERKTYIPDDADRFVRKDGSAGRPAYDVFRTDGSSGKTVSASQEPRFIPDEIELTIGDRVRHQFFGIGTVKSIDGQMATIDFGVGQLKKLDMTFAPLEKEVDF